jgi:hypothetical protein
MKMEPISAKRWFFKCGLAVAVPLLAYAAIAATGPKAPLLPATRDSALVVLDRYVQEPVPDIVLVGSSFTSRLREEYFDMPNLKVLGLSGGSSITGLEVVAARDRMPKLVLVEMNVLERGEDTALVEKITGGANVFTWPRPIRSAIAFYERWLHAPPDALRVKAEIAEKLKAIPSDFDNRVYVDRVKREWSTPAPNADTTKNLAVLQRLIKQIEARGSSVYFYSLPYADALQGSVYAAATHAVARATFADDRQWLHLEFPMTELRWADGVHLDERSAILVAGEVSLWLKSNSKISQARNGPQ